jgi:flagellar hook-associated protein 1 FlgK
MAGGMLGTAITGLQAFQRSLETTSHNISNVNTEGYSRQSVNLVTNKEQMIGVGYLGTGVTINNISRSYDQFITTQLRSSTAAYGDVDKYSQLASQVDDILADPAVGMAPAIKNFFNAVNDATDDPSSIPARQVLLSETEILTSRFDTMNSRFEQIREQINTDIVVMADEISAYAATIADLNVRISSEQGRASGNQQPNDLLDKRDQALVKLAELVDISVVPSNNNMVNVFMGKGHVLVLDTIASSTVTQPSEFDPTKLEIGIKSGSGTIAIVTKQIAGGALAGTLRFRDEVLDPAQQRLGSVAVSIAMEFNTIHEAGYDLDGNAGTLFFKGQGIGVTPIPVAASITNAIGSSVTAMFDNTIVNGVSNITNIDYSDYQLDVSAGPVYTLTRLIDNTSITLTETTPPVTIPPTPVQLVATLPDELPGITIEPTGLTDGDSFLIRPTYSAASTIEQKIIDSREVALATNAAIDSSGNPYTITGPMPGDNRNGLALAELENKRSMLGGTASFQDGYGLIVSEVGVLTSSAKIATAAQETLLNNAKSAWGNVSGVNLDEEAANLIKFQQSYQAAAQMISVSDNLFNALLGAVRG